MTLNRQVFLNKVHSFIASRWFLAALVGLFVLQAGWIAFSFRYPLLYDEGVHVGITDYYSNGLWPLRDGQPEKYDLYGDVNGQGSYLFHYLLSFPYRFATNVFDGQAEQRLFLRLLNIAMFSGGIVIFARLLRAINVKPATINISLLFFVLLPITPFVAATVNYDNMIFLLTPIFLLLCVGLLRQKRFNLNQYLAMILVGCAASLVKFVFIIIFAFALVFVTVNIFLRNRGKLANVLSYAIRNSNKWLTSAMLFFTVIFSFWFMYVYGLNIVNYGRPDPPCERTLSAERCEASEIVRRNNILVESTHLREAKQFHGFVFAWGKQLMTYVSWSGAGAATNVNEKPLPVFHFTMVALATMGVAMMVYSWRFLRKNIGYTFLALMLLVYVAAIFLTNASYYYKYHQLIATQPRYFLTLLPILMAFMVLGVNFVMRRYRRLKYLALIVFLVPYLNGAGIVTHIMRSDKDWYWQEDKIIEANLKAKKLLEPVIID